MADLIKTTVDKLKLADLELEKKPLVDARPELTADLIKEVVKQIKDFGLGSGYGSVASVFGLNKVSKSQVRRIHEQMKVRASELRPVPEIDQLEPVEEPIIE